VRRGGTRARILDQVDARAKAREVEERRCDVAERRMRPVGLRGDLDEICRSVRPSCRRPARSRASAATLELPPAALSAPLALSAAITASERRPALTNAPMQPAVSYALAMKPKAALHRRERKTLGSPSSLHAGGSVHSIVVVCEAIVLPLAVAVAVMVSVPAPAVSA
jgi:hypothetical protein